MMEDKKRIIDREFIKNSFKFSCLVLISATFITFIEALRTDNKKARHILNLETAVSLVASYIYSVFASMVDKEDFSLEKVTTYRYMDWVITTPMLLLALLLFISYLNKDELHLKKFLFVVLLNFGMLMSGYFGETGQINKYLALFGGFAFYISLVLFIWFVYIHGKGIKIQKIVFFFFFTVWSMYGVAFMFDEYTKNLTYNILDVIAKVFFGLFMWVFYGGVMVY